MGDRETWATAARRRSDSATAWAVWPPIPASISSKTIVGSPAFAWRPLEARARCGTARRPTPSTRPARRAAPHSAARAGLPRRVRSGPPLWTTARRPGRRRRARGSQARSAPPLRKPPPPRPAPLARRPTTCRSASGRPGGPLPPRPAGRRRPRAPRALPAPGGLARSARRALRRRSDASPPPAGRAPPRPGRAVPARPRARPETRGASTPSPAAAPRCPQARPRRARAPRPGPQRAGAPAPPSRRGRRRRRRPRAPAPRGGICRLGEARGVAQPVSLAPKRLLGVRLDAFSAASRAPRARPRRLPVTELPRGRHGARASRRDRHAAASSLRRRSCCSPANASSRSSWWRAARAGAARTDPTSRSAARPARPDPRAARRGPRRTRAATVPEHAPGRDEARLVRRAQLGERANSSSSRAPSGRSSSASTYASPASGPRPLPLRAEEEPDRLGQDRLSGAGLPDDRGGARAEAKSTPRISTRFSMRRRRSTSVSAGSEESPPR